ncbi:MAG: NAD-dependent epimerase/dehydratase family protein [Nitrospirae bacterium]|nr:NAD-dependent epimerase/dehydratase family protein [Nitrospirota bacterium]
MRVKRCAITGANGFIGCACSNHLLRNGYDVVKLVRHPQDGLSHYFDLSESVDPEVFRNIDALVHFAYDYHPRKWTDIYQINVTGSQRLFQAAQQAGLKKIIFISTVSAFEGCKSLYGKAKLEIETAALQMGIVVIRPGLTYLNMSDGMFGALSKMAKYPVLPAFDGGQQPFVLVHLDDLCCLIEKVINDDRDSLSKPIVAAHPEYVPFQKMMRMISQHHGQYVTFVPVPGYLAWLGLYALEVIGVNVGFRSDSLKSMLNSPPKHDFSGSEKFAMTYRQFSAWLSDVERTQVLAETEHN